MANRRRGSVARERLSPDTIVDGAIALADAEGIDAVTIRRLAQDHEVTPMALYWHFKDKGELLDGIAERLFAGVRLPAPSRRPWPEQLRSILDALLDALRPHPQVGGLISDRVLSSEAGLTLAERTLALLRHAGLSVERAAPAALSKRRVLCQCAGGVPQSGRLLQPRARHADRRRHRHRRTRFSRGEPGLTW